MKGLGYLVCWQALRRLARHGHLWRLSCFSMLYSIGRFNRRMIMIGKSTATNYTYLCNMICLRIGAPCSTWIWISRGSTFRSHLRPRGNKRRSKAVRMANRMVRRICCLKLGCMLDATYSVCGPLFVTNAIPRIEYARKKDGFWTIEQPQSSLLPYYRPFEACVFPFPVSQRIPPSNRSIHE